MKKIITSVGMIVFIGALIAGGTGAFFSDAETSTGNVFTAGAIDLKVDSQQHYNGNVCTDVDPGEGVDYEWVGTSTYPIAGTACDGTWTLTDLGPSYKFFNFGDVKPGDEGENTISLHIDSNPAWACADVAITSNDDMSTVEPELEAGDATNTVSILDGELAQNLMFTAWLDNASTSEATPGDNIHQPGEVLFFTPGPASDVLAGGSLTLADGGTGTPLPGGSTSFIGLAWCAGTMTATTGGGQPTCDGSTMGNEVQTDSMTADLTFRVEQARNNEEFRCDEGDNGEPTPRESVGAVLSSYVAPAICSATVTGSSSIQAALNVAADNSTVCVDPTYDMSGDNVAIRMEKLGVTLAATVRGVDLDVPVVLSNSNVTVTGFDGLIGQAESPAEQTAFYVDGDADSFEISYNTVNGGVGAGILTETGGANAGGLITNNTLSGATQGIYINPHTGVFTIEFNDIDNNAAGIAGLNGATVQFNQFEHTTPGSEAIGVDPTIDANPAVVHFNNFLNGMMLNTYVGLAGNVNAINNFWGPNGGAAQTGGTDQVNFVPEEVSAFPHN